MAHTTNVMNHRFDNVNEESYDDGQIIEVNQSISDKPNTRLPNVTWSQLNQKAKYQWNKLDGESKSIILASVKDNYKSPSTILNNHELYQALMQEYVLDYDSNNQQLPTKDQDFICANARHQKPKVIPPGDSQRLMLQKYNQPNKVQAPKQLNINSVIYKMNLHKYISK